MGDSKRAAAYGIFRTCLKIGTGGTLTCNTYRGDEDAFLLASPRQGRKITSILHAPYGLACCGLLTLEEESNVLQLVHHSAGEYFRTARTTPSLRSS